MAQYQRIPTSWDDSEFADEADVASRGVTTLQPTPYPSVLPTPPRSGQLLRFHERDAKGSPPPRPFPFVPPGMDVPRRPSINSEDFDWMTSPASNSPVRSFLNDGHKQLSSTRGNIRFKDASVNTDCSLFYEGAPLCYHNHQQQQQQPPHPASSLPIHPNRLTKTRPFSFIDNLNSSTASNDVDALERAEIQSPPTTPSPPKKRSLFSSLSPSSSAPRKDGVKQKEKQQQQTPESQPQQQQTPQAQQQLGKSSEQTPRAATGKRAKFLHALAKVGIKTATRARRDFRRLEMENSDSD